MYNTYNPYLNRYYGQQQPQPMEMPIPQQTMPQMAINRLNGKQVDSIEVVKATDISLDGSVNYFPNPLGLLEQFEVALLLWYNLIRRIV